MITNYKKTILVILFFSIKFIFIADAKDDKDIDLIENSIIIEGLHTESELESGDDFQDDKLDDDAEIIYDDSFEIGQPTDKKTSTVKNTDKKNNTKINKTIDVVDSKNILRSLQRKDKRWHYINYKIKKNDNLWSISRIYDIDYKTIIKINNIKNANNIKTGIKIKVPSKKGFFYKVKKGDTLTSISQKYKVKIEFITKQNKIRNDLIKLNELLFLPEAKKLIKATADKTANNDTVLNNSSSFKRNNNNQTTISSNDEKYVSDIYRKQTKFSWPLIGKITSRFGVRNDPISGKRKFHCGVDIGTPKGTKVKSARSGVVIYAGWKNGYGKVVILKHKHGYITVYAHLNKIKVNKNQKVLKNQLIGLSGSTGRTTGAHLHFEIRKYLTPLNPLRMLL